MHDLNYFRDHLEVFAEMAKKRNIALDLDAFRALTKSAALSSPPTSSAKPSGTKPARKSHGSRKKNKTPTRLIAEMEAGFREHQAKPTSASRNWMPPSASCSSPFPTFRTPLCPPAQALRTMSKSAVGALPRDLISSPSPIGKPAKARTFWICPPPQKSPVRAFAVYKGWGARLERALANFFLDVHTREHGYTEILPPFLVNTASLMGAGQLPKFAADLFKVENSDFWLTPTSEVGCTISIAMKRLQKTNCRFS